MKNLFVTPEFDPSSNRAIFKLHQKKYLISSPFEKFCLNDKLFNKELETPEIKFVNLSQFVPFIRVIMV